MINYLHEAGTQSFFVCTVPTVYSFTSQIINFLPHMHCTCLGEDMCGVSSTPLSKGSPLFSFPSLWNSENPSKESPDTKKYLRSLKDRLPNEIEI